MYMYGKPENAWDDKYQIQWSVCFWREWRGGMGYPVAFPLCVRMYCIYVL